MKKLLSPLFLILLTLVACDNKGNQGNDNATDNATDNTETNDAAEKAAREKAIADSIAKDSLAKDSAEYVMFRSADLNAFFLHGRVKTVVESESNTSEGSSYSWKNVITFNKQGVLTSYKYDNENMPIRRSKGHIYTIDGDDYAAQSMMTFHFNGNNQLTTLADYTGHGGYTYTYKGYNANGLPSSASVVGSYAHMGYANDSKGSIAISYKAFDENNNFTKCVKTWKLHEEGVELDENGEDEIPYSNNYTRVESISRTITYYTREELGLK